MTLLDEMYELLAETESLDEKVDPGHYVTALYKDLSAQIELVKALDKVIGRQGFEDLDVEERKQIAGLYSQLVKAAEKAKASTTKVGAFLAMKDIVSLPGGSTGWS